MSELALIGLGSNLGDRKALLDGAVVALGSTPGIRVQVVSSYHESRPIGGPSGQGRFLNAAAALVTSLDPLALLRRLQQIEAEAGRVRSVRWGERTLDLDILLYGDAIIDTTELTVPHLRIAVRRFVLAPLAEIAPDAVDPLTRRSVKDLLANLDRRPSVVALARSTDDPVSSDRLAWELGAVCLTGLPTDLNPAPWFTTWMEQFKATQFAPRRDQALVLDACEKLQRALKATEGDRRHREQAPGMERWVLTDARFQQALAPEAGLLEAASSLFRPTFIVMAGPDAEENLREWAAREHADDPFDPAIPRLRVRQAGNPPGSRASDRESLLEEILAACAATRA